ncbi:hypothetical protein GPALN_005113 [Globodera pallida]|nr:hypothetical protein GPALN_005113 [Globodera pallida]
MNKFGALCLITFIILVFGQNFLSTSLVNGSNLDASGRFKRGAFWDGNFFGLQNGNRIVPTFDGTNFFLPAMDSSEEASAGRAKRNRSNRFNRRRFMGRRRCGGTRGSSPSSNSTATFPTSPSPPASSSTSDATAPTSTNS